VFSVINITGRHGPYAMKMIGKNNNRIDRKWMGIFHLSDYLAQRVDMLDKETVITARCKVGSKEIAASRFLDTAIVCHWRPFQWAWFW
jgi:hypothetical protein